MHTRHYILMIIMMISQQLLLIQFSDKYPVVLFLAPASFQCCTQNNVHMQYPKARQGMQGKADTSLLADHTQYTGVEWSKVSQRR